MRCASYGVEPTDIDRSCGFLTRTEREYLLGVWEPGGDGATEKQKSNKRSEIQTRTRHALADLALLQTHASEELKSGIIEHSDDPVLFDTGAMEAMIQGLLRLSMDISAGEEVSDTMFDTLTQTAVDERVVPLLQAAQADDQEQLMTEVVALLGETLDDLDIDEGKQKQLAVELNSHLHSA